MLRLTALLAAALLVLAWGAAARGDRAGPAPAKRHHAKKTKQAPGTTTITTTTIENGKIHTTTKTVSSDDAPPAWPPKMFGPMVLGKGGTLAADTSGRSCNRGATADPKSRVDLTAGDAAESLQLEGPKSKLQVGLTVANLGRGASGAFAVGVYLYSGSDPCRAYRLGTIRTGSLPAHGRRALEGVFHLNAASKRPPKGVYELGFVIDVDGVVAEHKEDNNVSKLSSKLTFD